MSYYDDLDDPIEDVENDSEEYDDDYDSHMGYSNQYDDDDYESPDLEYDE